MCRSEKIIFPIASGSLFRSIRGETVSSAASRQISVTRFTIDSSVSSKYEPGAMFPYVSFFRKASIGSNFFHASTSSPVR